ncbi:hypothetical protein EDD90_3901 [Streptomyces sp. Ag109_O5-1]|nr:hypothetical protein EDD90_3901 [Streptomyces sp. Ag109_O5-1]
MCVHALESVHSWCGGSLARRGRPWGRMAGAIFRDRAEPPPHLEEVFRYSPHLTYSRNLTLVPYLCFLCTGPIGARGWFC